jgi:hypothetical protein
MLVGYCNHKYGIAGILVFLYFERFGDAHGLGQLSVGTICICLYVAGKLFSFIL